MQKPQNSPKYLTQEQSVKRGQQIVKNSIKYQLELNLEKDYFSGTVRIRFDLHNIVESTFLDFNNEKLERLVINGSEVQMQWDGLFIQLPKENLKTLENEVMLQFSCKYANDGSGFHQFTDTDGKQYLYTQCEAYLCNRIFPNFDQPDLKATMECKVTIPGDQGWTVLSNESVSSKIEQDSKIIYTFPSTKLLPTYLFAFVCGNYLEIKGENTYNNIPMSIFCRESLYKHLQNLSEFIFEVTNGAMKMYEEYFGVKYPFNKYDQIFCAEYNHGAMENAGIVTFNDDYVWREEVDSSKNTWLAIVITHELSHHWFGDLVTMKWWNDRQVQNIWLAFNGGKSHGYRADQLATTHPIAGDVPNTEAADSIFDGITYEKGAATLKQLMALMGEESFSKGLKSYFTEFAFSNTVLSDFINHLNVEFEKKNLGFNLQDWQQEWIQKAGLNECLAQFDPQNTQKDALLQTAALQQHPTLRRHKMKIAFFNENCELTVQNVLLNAQPETAVQYDGSKNYKALMLNYEDETFIKVLLDDHSIAFFKQNLYKIGDDLTRTLIWRAFFDMLRDGKLSSEEYADIFVQQIPLEKSEDIISNQFSFLTSIQSFTPTQQYRSILAKRIYDFIVKYLNQIQANKQLVLTVKSHLITFVEQKEDIQFLIDWYHGKNEQLKNIEVGNSLEWSIVEKVHKSSHFNNQQRKQIFEDQSKKDQTDVQKQEEIMCNTLVATLEERAKLWDSFYPQESTLSLRQLEFQWRGFNNDTNEEEIKPYWDKWFSIINNVFKEKNNDFAKMFYYYLKPKYQDLDYFIQKLNNALQQVQVDQIMLKKKLLDTLDDCQRQQKCHKCFYERAPMAKN